MNRFVILVGIGGFFGSIARYLASVIIAKTFITTFPYSTFAVNISGCLLAGMVLGFSERFGWLPEWRIFLATGFCGGFTTFSSFTLESVALLQDKDYVTFASYSILSFVFGMTATLIGLFLTRG